VLRNTGYFAAPAARLYPLSHRKSRRPKPLPPVTLVFCAIDGYHDVMAENHVHGELTTTQCYNACRQLLKDRNGYECGTEEGTFLAAFASGTDALQFCVVVSAAWLCGAVSRYLCTTCSCWYCALLSPWSQPVFVCSLLQLLQAYAAAKALSRLI